MPNEPNERCEACRFYGERPYGVCRKHAAGRYSSYRSIGDVVVPIVSPFPPVYSSEWCGDYKPKREVKNA